MKTTSIVVACTTLALLGCPNKNTAAGSPPAADAAPPPAASAAAPQATNEAQIARYGDERVIDHEAGTIRTPKGTVLKSVPKGDTVATLKKGDTVTELAEHNGYLRVTFADPQNASAKLMGWIAKFAFDDPPPAATVKVPKCTGDATVIASVKPKPIVPFCTQLCTEDSDCPSGECESGLILDGKGAPLVVNGDTHVLPVCAPVKSAAKTAAADAGKPKGPPMPDCPDGTRAVADDEHSKIWCGKDCDTDKDCGGAKGSCITAMQMDGPGEPHLSHNGSPIGATVCKPSSK